MNLHKKIISNEEVQIVQLLNDLKLLDCTLIQKIENNVLIEKCGKHVSRNQWDILKIYVEVIAPFHSIKSDDFSPGFYCHLNLMQDVKEKDYRVYMLNGIRKTINYTISKEDSNDVKYKIYKEIEKTINELIKDDFKINQFNLLHGDLLVNCNSPREIGEEYFEKMKANLYHLVKDHYMRDRMNLGINLYKDDLDYSYIIELLKECGLHRVRISLTVPDFSACKNVNAIEYFKKRKPFLLKFLSDMKENNILPYYDCNKPPYCIWTEDEKEWLENMVAQYHVESNLIGDHSFCYPVIDILPNLQAVRCFGMSGYEKVNIDNFSGVSEIASYFLNHIDSASYQIPMADMCKECRKRQTRKCTAGCIGFKSDAITKLNEFAMNLEG